MKSRRDVLIFSIGLPMLIASWLAFSYFSRDELDVQLRALAGKGAVDCGAMARGVSDANATIAVQNCAVVSFKNELPFFYRAAMMPVSNAPLRSVGTVVTPKREMFLLSSEEPTWDKWFGRVTGKVQGYNPRLAAADNGTVTITFDRAPKPAKKPAPVTPSAETPAPPKSPTTSTRTSRSEQTRSEQTRSEQTRSEQTRSEQTRSAVDAKTPAL